MAISEVTTIEELASAPYTDEDDGAEVSAYMQAERDRLERLQTLRDALKSVSSLRTTLRFKTALSGISMNDIRENRIHRVHEQWYAAMDTAMAQAERAIMGMITTRENF